jgi:nicotinamide-nucleotide amidase
MIPESQADKLLAPIYTTYTDVETTLAGPRRRPADHARLLQADAEAASSAWTSSPSAWKRRSRTGSTPRRAIPWSRSCSTISACARPHWPWPKAAPAAWSPSASPAFPALALVSRRRGRLLRRLKTARWPACPPELIAQHGAVSAEVAKALAKASACAPGPPSAWELPASPAPPGAPNPSPWAWSTSPSPMPGLRRDASERTFRGDRQRIREWAAQQALDMVRRRLM